MTNQSLIKPGIFVLSLFVYLFIVCPPASAADTPGAVYVMTNSDEGNEIVVFDRDAKGRLTQVGSVPTGGLGSGGGLDPLGTQGSLILSRKWLLAVNAGSNSISVFRVLSEGLLTADIVDSGGDFPVSLTIHKDLVYVLNGTSPANIKGFRLGNQGDLTPIPGSARLLGSGAFAQIGFDPQGEMLVVTDRGDNEILVFAVNEDGLPSSDPVTSLSNGLVPFGFTFTQQGHLLVSEAGSGAVSSYAVLSDGSLQVITPSEENGQAATCWIAGNRRHVFTANTASGTISAYKVKAGKGAVMLREAVAGTGVLDIDMAVTINGRFLYVLNAGDGTLGMFQITSKGDLIDLGRIDGGLSIFTQGVAAR
jgi:6-phosphogluconolactonase (cycloisomerase 2 family)